MILISSNEVSRKSVYTLHSDDCTDVVKDFSQDEMNML